MPVYVPPDGHADPLPVRPARGTAGRAQRQGRAPDLRDEGRPGPAHVVRGLRPDARREPGRVASAVVEGTARGKATEEGKAVGERPVQTEILRATVGSRAYGTHTERSDVDERVVFVVPTVDFFRVDRDGNARPRTTLWAEDPRSKDVTGWEAQQFVKLALQCNPTALEVLWAPDCRSTPAGAGLRGVKEAFLSRQKVYDAFAGYAKNQRNKMFEQPEVAWSRRNWKFAEAYVRVLWQGFVLLSEGRLPVRIVEEAPELCEYLVRVKQGRVKAGAVVDVARTCEERLFGAVAASKLPDSPNLKVVNGWVREVRGL